MLHTARGQQWVHRIIAVPSAPRGELEALGVAHRVEELVGAAEEDVWILSEPVLLSEPLSRDGHVGLVRDLNGLTSETMYRGTRLVRRTFLRRTVYIIRTNSASSSV